VVVGRGEARAEKQPVLRRLWEAVVGTGKDVAEAVTPGRDEVETTVRFSGELGDEPALLRVLEVLPAALFGSLERAVEAGGAALGETVEGAAEAGRAARERGDRARKRR
jgi:hypothetical protein